MHNTIYVVDGNTTDTPLKIICSGVATLRDTMIIIFLLQLYVLDLWAINTRNTYVYAKTKEKMYIIVGSEFGDNGDHTIIIYKIIYGLSSSGLEWHERLTDCLRDVELFSCRVELI